MINDKSQGNVATRLRGMVVMYYYRRFVMFAGERIFNILIGEVTGNRVIASHALFSVFHALSCLRAQISPDNLRRCMVDRSCY